MAIKPKVDKTRPLTLYADEVQFHPDITSMMEPSIRSVDVEINRLQAEDIRKRLDEILEMPGHASVRIRFTGRMMQ